MIRRPCSYRIRMSLDEKILICQDDLVKVNLAIQELKKIFEDDDNEMISGLMKELSKNRDRLSMELDEMISEIIKLEPKNIYTQELSAYNHDGSFVCWELIDAIEKFQYPFDECSGAVSKLDQTKILHHICGCNIPLREDITLMNLFSHADQINKLYGEVRETLPRWFVSKYQKYFSYPV